MKKNVYLISFLVVALVLGAWTAYPAQSASMQFRPEQDTAECRSGVDVLTGPLAAMPAVQNRARQICGYDVRMAQIDESNVSQFDRLFIQHAIAGNMLEIQSLEYALTRVTNEEWRSLIQMMIAQHTHDLEAALAIAEKIGVDTTPDLTNMRTYPDTPRFDLGIRRVDLVAMYLDPLMAAGGGIPVSTPTVIPTLDGTGTATSVPTLESTATGVPTEAVTGTATTVPTVDLTGTATTVPTMDITETPTTIPTVDTTATETATGVPTMEATVTGTATTVPSLPTDTPTPLPTFTSTPIPPGGGSVANFDMVALHIIEDEHLMDVETALVAQRLVTNDEVRAFAKHAADVAGLHLLLMQDLKHRLFDNFTPPPPDFSEEYRGPRRFASPQTRMNEAGELTDENEGGE